MQSRCAATYQKMLLNIHKPILICGYHRSGTSMTGQIMHNAGLLLDRNPFTAHPSNPDSHFESDVAVKLHNDILNYNRTDWLLQNHDPNVDFEITTDHRAKAEMLRAKYARAENWGFKDPRSSLFIKFWADVLQRPRIIIVYRHFGYCQNSLLKRAVEVLIKHPNIDSESTQLWQNTDLSISAWLYYNQQLINYAQAYPEDCIVVSQEALLNGFDLITEVNTRFGLTLNHNVNSGVSELKVRSADSQYLAPSCAVLKNRAEAVWEKINSLSCAPACNIPAPIVFFGAEKKNAVFDFDKFIVPTQQGYKKEVLEPRNPDPITIEDLRTPIILNNKVNNIFNTGGADEIISMFEGFKVLEPENFQIELILGHAQMRLNRHSLALDHYLKAHSINPEHPNVLNHLAGAEMAEGYYSEAISHYESAIDAQPENARFWAFYCAALMADNQQTKALAECRRGKSETQPNQFLEVKFIELLILQGLVNEAEQSCKEALIKWPENNRFSALHFNILMLRGRRKEAQIAFDCTTRNCICNTPEYINKLQKVIESVENHAWSQALRESVSVELERVFKHTGDQMSPVSVSRITQT